MSSRRNKEDEESPLLLHHQLVNKASNSKEGKRDGTDYPPIKYTTEESDFTVATTESTIPSSDAPASCPYSLWLSYKKQLDLNPLLVKCITAFFILSLGDLTAQGIEHSRGKSNGGGVDWMRSGRFAVVGFFGAAWAHYFYHTLDACLPPTEAPCSTTTYLKVLIDQGIQAPIVLAVIIASLVLMQGEGWSGVKEEMEYNYWDALITNWKLWVPASIINLAFVSPQLRVLFINVVFFVWTVILSILLHNEQTK